MPEKPVDSSFAITRDSHMERVLAADPAYLFKKLQWKMQKVLQAIVQGNLRAAAEECIDVANYAMMLRESLLKLAKSNPVRVVTNMHIEYPPNSPIQTETVELRFERRIGPNDNNDDFPPVTLPVASAEHKDK